MEQHLAPEPDDVVDEGATLLDMLVVLVRRRWLILGLTAFAALAAGAYAWTLPDIYTASLKVAVPKGGPGPFVAALQSDEMGYAIVDRFELAAHYGDGDRTDARRTLKGRTRFTAGKDGLVLLEVDDTDPHIAANLAEGFVGHLMKMAAERHLTESAQVRRALVLHRARADKRAAALTNDDAEIAIPAGARFLIRLLADLRAEIALAPSDPNGMRMDAARMQEAVARLESQLQQVKSLRGTAVSLEQQQRYQELAFQTALGTKLDRQIELVGANEAIEIRPVSAAVPPDRKSKPQRSVIVAVSAAMAFVLTCGLVFAVEWIGAKAEARGGSGAWQRLRQAWSGER